MTTVEIWKPVVGYEDSYEVSNLGRVRGLDRVLEDGRRWKGTVKTLRRHPKTGHWRCNVSFNGKKTIRQVHTMMAQAFIPNKFGYEEVLIIDGNVDNLTLENLKWASRSECRHGRKKGVSKYGTRVVTKATNRD